MRRFRSLLLSLLLLSIFFVPQIGMAETLNNNIPEASPAVNVPILKSAISLPMTGAATTNQLNSARWLVHKDAVEGTSKLRLVIDTSDPVIVSSALDGNGPQLVLDIKGAVVGDLDDSITLDGQIAEKVRFIKKDGNNSQAIVDLPSMIDDGDYKVFTLKSDAANKKSFRVVVDINKPVPKVVYNFAPGLRNKLIVIDPGHGGSDPGAIGPNKVQEKTITLGVAQKVKAMLEKAGAKVLMTRQTDVDVYGPNASAVDELKARTIVANNNKADVFVSIHINAFSNPTVGGTATYYYQKSNYDALLATCIQDGLVANGGLQDRGTYTAGFYVIKRTTMPSILAELGFISNPAEEKLLSTYQFQQQMAQGIVQGLDKFFSQAAKRGGGL